MEKLIFWGEYGEYGPFMKQDDGWPHAGQVIRHYRRQHKMSADTLAAHYGQAASTHVTARWILKMEQHNQVPTDLTRRRILAKILHVPPVLLGLASLDTVTYQPPSGSSPQAPAILKQPPQRDLSGDEQYVRNRWLLSYTGEETLDGVLTRIATLEGLEKISRGSYQQHIWQLLNTYYQLASDVARHQGRFPVAFHYAGHAIRVSRLVGYTEILAGALYRRGYTSLEWAIFGDTVSKGVMSKEPDEHKLRAALSDFEDGVDPFLEGTRTSKVSQKGRIKNDEDVFTYDVMRIYL